MNKTDEKWYPIRGFANYEASNLGRVRKLDGTLMECVQTKRMLYVVTKYNI